jgi:molybdenum cofactor biosynthesis enzyme MoaA
MEIYKGGTVYSCCSANLKPGHSFGNAYNANSIEDFWAIWNSDNAKRLRYSVSQGNFEYCNSNCFIFSNAEKHPQMFIPRETSNYRYGRWEDCSLDITPSLIDLSCDDTCNLYCRSCRTRISAASSSENKNLYDFLQNFIRPALKNCRWLSCSGIEFFASKPTQQFYRTLSSQEFPNLRIGIATNGQLFTEENWSTFENIHDIISSISISIDAANKETYEMLRRGGSWEKLCNNMDYISSLRKSCQIKSLQINFVVQRENFRQMEEFVNLGEQWCVNNIYFTRLDNRGSYKMGEHEYLDVFNPQNEHYSEAKSILTAIKETSEGIRISENCLT